MSFFGKKIVSFLILLLVILGFYFRISGILTNHSFWSDEALTASFARDIALGKVELLRGATAIIYQPFHIITMSVFMKIFGITEFAARLPSVIFGSVGILITYLLAEKFSHRWGGLFAAFIFTFSQLNLANSTQAKPQAIIQTITLFVIYLMSIVSEASFKKKVLLHILIIFSIITATLFHFLAGLLFLLYITYLYFSFKNILLKIFVLLVFFIGAVIYFKANVSAAVFNNTMYLKNLLLRQYGIFIVAAGLSLVLLYKKNKELILAIIIYSSALLFWWNFQSYSHNLRYLATFFGILFVFAGIGLAKSGVLLLKKNGWIFVVLIFLILLIKSHKINLKPISYYSPNSDFYGDVQIANYKEFYAELSKKFPDLSGVVIYNDTFDSQRWYLAKQADAYFAKNINKPLTHKTSGKKIYGSLKEFINLKNKNKKGLLIVEDWESILPEDIKQYAKKNLKLELRVESLPEAKDDPWPLELYSWGI